jgi:hypothetical protein
MRDWIKNKLDGASSNKTYIGTVEDNKDPKRLGRCRIRVFDIFDEKDRDGKYEISVEDLPWATPWRDVNGNNFNLPDIGKVITVMFEDGNKNNPIYISSDHYNVNLEKKLEQLSEPDYLSMKALIYDHKTQIYVNDSEGLKIDHKFNNINIKEQSINVNLKDNFGKINIGSPNSTQRAILGDNFANWLDEFLNILMGDKGGPFLGNLLAPVVATPALIAQIQLYFSLKDPKILSKNVYIVDNDSVSTQERTEGGAAKDTVSQGQKGDTWVSTVDDNKLTTKEAVKYTPIEGASNTTFNKPPADATEPVPASELAPENPSHHPDVDVVLEMMRAKKYKIFTRPYELNIIAVRNQCIVAGDRYTDEFVDKLYTMWKDDKGAWQLKQFVFSTVPGVEFEVTENWIKDKKFSGQELEYWKKKVGTKITMKEYYKGPVTPPVADIGDTKPQTTSATPAVPTPAVPTTVTSGNKQYVATGTKFCSFGSCRLDIKVVDKTTSQIITSQGSEGADVKQLYPKVVKLVQDDLVAKKISGVTLPTLEQIVDTGTGTTGNLGTIAKSDISIEYLGEFDTVQGNDYSYFNIRQSKGTFKVLRIIDSNFNWENIGIVHFKNDKSEIVTHSCNAGSGAQTCEISVNGTGTYKIDVEYYPNGPLKPEKINIKGPPFISTL